MEPARQGLARLSSGRIRVIFTFIDKILMEVGLTSLGSGRQNLSLIHLDTKIMKSALFCVLLISLRRPVVTQDCGTDLQVNSRLFFN